MRKFKAGGYEAQGVNSAKKIPNVGNSGLSGDFMTLLFVFKTCNFVYAPYPFGILDLKKRKSDMCFEGVC